MEKISDVIKMQIIMYCEAIQKGTKPVAMLSIQSSYVDKAKEYIESEGMKIYIKDVVGDGNWKVIFIYKYEYLLDVIKATPEYPNSIFEHWVLGKLFGYSDGAIKDFLTTLYDM